MPHLNGFIPLFALGEVALFSLNAVANAAAMWTVPLRLRSLACAVVTITIHVLGDVPAPPIVGIIQDSLNRSRGVDPNNWRTSLSVIICALLLAVVLFGAGAWLALRRVAITTEWSALMCPSQRALAADTRNRCLASTLSDGTSRNDPHTCAAQGRAEGGSRIAWGGLNCEAATVRRR